MRLAEASYLKEHRGHEPVLLLDDVLSELDPVRRLQVLEHAGQYQQCFITTADVATIDRSHISGMSRFLVRAGMVEAGGVTGQAGPQ
jgi:DNA replication and repair protein RecF